LFLYSIGGEGALAWSISLTSVPGVEEREHITDFRLCFIRGELLLLLLLLLQGVGV
jgi:hypothetical protein